MRHALKSEWPFIIIIIIKQGGGRLKCIPAQKGTLKPLKPLNLSNPLSK